jgi:hypothetical protein
MIIAARNLKEVLEKETANAEYFRILISYKSQVLDGFSFLNILDVFDCLDKKRTIRVGHGPFPHDIKRLALDCNRIGDSPLFRIAGAILVGTSDALATEVEKAGCTGVVFKSPEEWRNIVLLGE